MNKMDLLPEAADLVLKGSGLLGVAGVVESVALKAKTLWLIIPMTLTGMVLWVIAGALFVMAVVKTQAALTTDRRLPKWAERSVGVVSATLIAISMTGLMAALRAGVVGL